MGFWGEVQNNFFECGADIRQDDGDILARITIDAWKTADEDEPGDMIARVLLGKHGDVMVDYHDNVARVDKMAQEAIADAMVQLREYYKEVQNEKCGLAVPLGSAVFLAWEDIDDQLRKWSSQYFGRHMFAEGSRDQEYFEVLMDGLKEEDYEKYCLLFEKYDKEKDYEPESIDVMASYAVTLSSSVARGVMQEAMEGKGLAHYGSAFATDSGVFFMERNKDDKEPVALRDVLERASGADGQTKDAGAHDDLSL